MRNNAGIVKDKSISPADVAARTLARRNQAHKGQDTRFERRIASAQCWREAEADGVILHYLPDRNPPDVISDKADRFDKALRQNLALFQVEPLSFKVRIYLFPDAVAHGEALGESGPAGFAQALYHGASMVDSTWEDQGPEQWGLKYLAVHEQAHVVHWQGLYGLYYPRMPTLFSEGGAVWAQNQVAETAFVSFGADAPGITDDRSIRTLLAEGWGFDYDHAGAYYGYLLDRVGGGMDAMKAFMRRLSLAPGEHDDERVDAAMQAVYGLSLEEMELEWRGGVGEAANAETTITRIDNAPDDVAA